MRKLGAGTRVPTVTVVIPTFNRADYLRDALASVIGQTRPLDEIIVVDDGSDDDTAAVVAEFPQAILLRQENRGPSAARNTGIRAAKSDYVLCLDSDDVLVPNAIESSLACLAENPGVAFVYGGHQIVDENLEPLDRPRFTAMPRDAYHDLLRNNSVYMLGTVLFDRAKLLDVGGFDARLARSEDYDLFLRLARNNPVAGDPTLIAKYRMHAGNLSAHASEMLAAALALQERHRPDEGDAAGMLAYARGKKTLTRAFVLGAWRAKPHLSRRRKWEERLAMARISPLNSLAAAAWELARRRLPRPMVNGLKRLLRGQAPAVGHVGLGDLKRVRPISRHFGYDRGTPIDRYYIEKFLSRRAADIHGRVLEIGDDAYSRAFGSNVTAQDVLHVNPDHPGATIVGDLSKPGTLPEATFDCLVVTQTLHLIFEAEAAVRELWRGLRPGGVALVSVPGVASVDRGEFGGTWYWSFTGIAAQRMFSEVFGKENVEVETFGNVYAATCFLQGLALQEVEPGWLDKVDLSYPMIVAVRARRAG